ncbi:hypothetical protein C0580_04920 [Candidatus Parcubacteria bacterium]|nr:MAG: hypothetical protein C0580_04920 [Candidatus Parcubacteria bacterium]
MHGVGEYHVVDIADIHLRELRGQFAQVYVRLGRTVFITAVGAGDAGGIGADADELRDPLRQLGLVGHLVHQDEVAIEKVAFDHVFRRDGRDAETVDQDAAGDVAVRLAGDDRQHLGTGRHAAGHEDGQRQCRQDDAEVDQRYDDERGGEGGAEQEKNQAGTDQPPDTVGAELLPFPTVLDDLTIHSSSPPSERLM